jgi:hypothetical protein
MEWMPPGLDGSRGKLRALQAIVISWAVVLSWRRIIILRSQRLPQWSKLPNDSHPCSHDRRFLPSEAKSLGVPQAWLKQVKIKLVSRALRNIRHRRAL